MSCVPKVTISLDCPFMIAHSVQSDVDLLKLMIWVIFNIFTKFHFVYLLIGNI